MLFDIIKYLFIELTKNLKTMIKNFIKFIYIHSINDK